MSSRQAAYEKRQRAKGATLVAVRLDQATAALLNQAAEIHGSKTAALVAALEDMMNSTVTITLSNVNDPAGARVTVFGLFQSGWQAATMFDRDVGNPRSFRDSDEEFTCRFVAPKGALQRICAALNAGTISRETLIEAGGNYGGKEKINFG